MKKHASLFIAVNFCISATMFSQVSNTGDKDEKKFRIGGRFGLGEATMQCGGLSNIQPKLAMSGGIVTNYSFNRYLTLNADFLLSSVGVKSEGSTRKQNFLGNDTYYSYKERYDFINAEIPITGQLNLWMGDFFVKGYAGPAINFVLISTQTRRYDDSNYDSENGYVAADLPNTNNVYSSMIYGLGIGAKSSDDRIFFLDFRLNRAIGSAAKINSYNALSNYYCISAGYTF